MDTNHSLDGGIRSGEPPYRSMATSAINTAKRPWFTRRRVIIAGVTLPLLALSWWVCAYPRGMIVALGPHEIPESLGPHEIPESWSFAEIEELLLPRKVHVLAWSIEEDGSGVRIERCIAIRVPDKDNGCVRWHAEHFYRKPGTEDREWKRSITHVLDDDFAGAWYWHYKQFTERPSSRAMYAAMDSYKELDWSFEGRFRGSNGYKLVSCGICEKSWEEVTGERPTRFFKR